jgi:putative ABC transport system permease protein
LPTEAGILAGVFLLVGIVLLIPAVLDHLLRFAYRKLASRMQVEVRLAHQQIPRRHARSVLTVGVLFVAASTGIGISNSLLDNIQDVEVWYRRAIVGDFFVRAMMPDMATGLSADLPEGLGTEISAAPGVTGVDTVRFVRATAAGQSVVVIVREFTSDAQVYFDLKSGDPGRVRSQLLAGEVVIGTVLAQKTGLKLGDQISIDTRKGLQPFCIAGLANEYLVGGLAVHMDRQAARQWLEVDGVDGYIIRANPANLAGAQAALQNICDKHGVLLHSFADISRFIDEMMVEINACLGGILVLGFVVAAFGVVNTLTMNVLEQTREIGLLRVIAMTRRQVRKTILSQATILGVAGLGAGTVAGLGVAYLINLATMPAIGHPVEFRFRPLLLAGSFLGAFAMVLAAAWLPAQRAARLQLTTALKYE